MRALTLYGAIAVTFVLLMHAREKKGAVLVTFFTID